MKKVINKNNHKIVFPKFDISFQPDEIKEVTDKTARQLMSNIHIEEVVSKKDKKGKTKKKSKRSKKN